MQRNLLVPQSVLPAAKPQLDAVISVSRLESILWGIQGAQNDSYPGRDPAPADKKAHHTQKHSAGFVGAHERLRLTVLGFGGTPLAPGGRGEAITSMQ